MAEENIDIKRVTDTAANIEAGGVIDGQWAFANDTFQIIVREGASYYRMAGLDATNTFTASQTLGAGADLIGSSTSDITINTDKFTVAGASGNTVVGGTLQVDGNATIGDGTAGTDFTLTFDGETNDGVLQWMEDEDSFYFHDKIGIGGPSEGELLHIEENAPEIHLKSTNASGVTWSLHSQSTGNFAIVEEDAGVTALSIVKTTGVVTINKNLTIGDGTAGTDFTLTFDGETNDGVLTWMEDEDYFKLSDDVLIDSTEKLYLNDTSSYIQDDGTDLIMESDGSVVLWKDNTDGTITTTGWVTRPPAYLTVSSAGPHTLDSFTMAASHIYIIEAYVVCSAETGGDSGNVYKLLYKAWNGASTNDGVVNIQKLSHEGDSGLDAVIDESSDSIRVRVTSDTDTRDWSCVMKYYAIDNFTAGPAA